VWTAWWFGLKTIGGGFDQFGPQNRKVVDQRTCGGISKLASRRSEVEKVLGLLDRRENTWTVLPIEDIGLCASCKGVSVF
jgi:hypothetical protein